MSNSGRRSISDVMMAEPNQQRHMAEELATTTREGFRERFGRMPDVVAYAPGRVNLIGDHTDYCMGYVLPIAINRGIAVALGRSSEGTIIQSLDMNLEYTGRIDGQLRPTTAPSVKFANYPLGVIRQFLDRGTEIGQLDMSIGSTVPAGGGLSSSAALEVSTAIALASLTSVDLDPLQVALLTQKAEHEFPGTPCGIMDMYVSAAAEADHALLIDCRTNRRTAVPMPRSDRYTIMVVDTRKTHDLATDEYADRRRACETAARMIGVDSLRDADAEMINKSIKDPKIHGRARHVVEENTRVMLAAAAMHTGDVEAIGSLMYQSHESLRDLFEVSCDEADHLVSTAREIGTGGGVLGARMTGGGFGGSVVVLCAMEHAEHASRKLTSSYVDKFGQEPGIFTTRACEGARIITGP